MISTSPAIRAPRGREISCKGWHQEAALRMLMNNLDPEVAEKPEELIVYGGTGRAARDWPSFDAIVRCLRELEDDETLLVQSGKPVGIFRTHADAPRVLHREFEPGRPLVQLRRVPPPGAARPHHVRPDDRRLVDLHRQPGHRARHVRNLRRRRGASISTDRCKGSSSSPAAWAAWAARSRSPRR